MNQEENPMSQEQAAKNLKEVYQKFDEDHGAQPSSDESDQGADDAVQQNAGSDADEDRTIGYDDSADIDEAAQQVKGSDADTA
ncbi:hypothetical protein SAMN06265348_102177 [Pedobacter westerhofensis]|uniref:Uncharacterized protein n=1 Tax=Pedobacter westerhofensis TaxID=425512 RepID=A0A521BBR5_9SPHI|nr:hypothetical protein [Pedobacter westerhofensis]SMO44537.1 hypothetical protein SAMN06265348_102177 [Pedobacter westerhofensis]